MYFHLFYCAWQKNKINKNKINQLCLFQLDIGQDMRRMLKYIYLTHKLQFDNGRLHVNICNF